MRVAAIVCLLLSGSLRAAEVVCPPAVHVRQAAIDVPAGWTVSTGTAPAALAHVTFFDGKPEEEASLVYDRMTPGKTHSRAEWNFPPGSHIWMACSYTSTTIVLSQELPGVKRCVVLYRRPAQNSAPARIEKMYCR